MKILNHFYSAVRHVTTFHTEITVAEMFINVLTVRNVGGYFVISIFVHFQKPHLNGRILQGDMNETSKK